MARSLSAAWCIICVMPGEDEIVVPDAWRQAVHPRRHGMAVPGLEWPGPEVPGGAAGAVRAALTPVDAFVAERGLAGAVTQFAESGGTGSYLTGTHVPSLVRPGDDAEYGDRDTWVRGFPGEAARHLRWRLAVAPQDVYDTAVAALAGFRGGPLGQRIVASYLVPDRADWVSADLAGVAAARHPLEGLLFYSAATAGQLSGFRAATLEAFVTAYDAVGHEVVPLLVRWLTGAWWWPETRRDAIEVLTRIPVDAAFGGLLEAIELPGVPGGVRVAAGRFPRRAARMLAARRDVDLVNLLFVAHVGAHPDVPEAGLVVRVPDAPAEAVPRLLASPPWHRKPPPRVTVPPGPLMTEPRIVWREGEREEWAYDWKAFTAEEMRKHLPLAETGDAPAEFYISGPADLVRPRLAAWKAESTWFFLQEPQVVVGKYELDALPPVLRLARRKPAAGAALLMPYLAPEVGELMAQWLTRSRSFRPVALQWFARHGAGAAALLIPVALGAPAARSRTAALALAQLDTGDVLAAAGKLGCRDAMRAFLDRDPLDLIPARIPAVPDWADPAFLPQVLLAGRRYALPRTETAALLRMIAMSQLEVPYEGLRVIAGQCDPASLSDFAWSLYRLWEAEERPSKHVWAMNALGYFGDDTVANRLAPLVRAWPHAWVGMAPRAKRGADVLAAIGTGRALGHLSALARNAKSIPLRTHAAAALDRAAADRGLLPEQLDDLVAPDLGLDGDPVRYRGVCYTVDLDASGVLVLQDPSGIQLATLPEPATDDERAVTAAWRSRRRKARPVVADQTARLEEAMIVQRPWTAASFRVRIAGHPLLGRLARELVWALDNRTVGLGAQGDLVDPQGRPAGPGEWVRLAHPAIDDFSPWRAWLARRSAPQPFAQAEREVFAGEDPSAYWHRTVNPAALHGLLRRGWHWGPAGQGGRRYQMLRPFGATGRVVLTIEPGAAAFLNPNEEVQQTITQITFESSAGELGIFADLPLVTRSELIRSLRTLN